MAMQIQLYLIKIFIGLFKLVLYDQFALVFFGFNKFHLIGYLFLFKKGGKFDHVNISDSELSPDRATYQFKFAFDLYSVSPNIRFPKSPFIFDDGIDVALPASPIGVNNFVIEGSFVLRLIICHGTLNSIRGLLYKLLNQ